MSDKREVFTILEDDATAEGVKLPARAQGDAAGGNHMPSIDAKDSAGNYILHEKRIAGEASAAVSSMPSLAAKDTAGNLQFVNMRDAGDAAAGTSQLPAFVSVDSTGLYTNINVRQEGAPGPGVNSLPVIGSIDSAGNLKFIELRVPGDAAAGVKVEPVMPVKDLAGNLDYINARDEGDAIVGVDAIPVLAFKDLAGNFKYPLINNAGELVVSSEAAGVESFVHATVTPAGINTLTTVANLTLNTSKTYAEIGVRASCSFPTKWELVKNDNAVLTVLDSFLTGSGQFTFAIQYKHMFFTSGAAGTQQLRLRATQLNGAASDMHGYVEALERA